MSVVEVVVPQGMFGPEADYLIDAIIRAIAKVHTGDGEWSEKYGTDVDNDVFMMRPYCWCEREDCPWCTGEMPNFWYKPTDFKVSWYKFIGRSMEFNRPISAKECAEILSGCLLETEEIINSQPVWSKEWPTEPGLYWFYGWRFRDRDRPPKFHCTEVWKISNGFAFVTRGHFLYKAEGAEGRWTPVMLPSPPEDLEVKDA